MAHDYDYDPRLDQMRAEDGCYYAPGSTWPRSRHEAAGLLEINDWVGREVPVDTVGVDFMLKVIRSIESLERVQRSLCDQHI